MAFEEKFIYNTLDDFLTRRGILTDLEGEQDRQYTLSPDEVEQAAAIFTGQGLQSIDTCEVTWIFSPSDTVPLETINIHTTIADPPTDTTYFFRKQDSGIDFAKVSVTKTTQADEMLGALAGIDPLYADSVGRKSETQVSRELNAEDAVALTGLAKLLGATI